MESVWTPSVYIFNLESNNKTKMNLNFDYNDDSEEDDAI